jgi:hypothetical protein
MNGHSELRSRAFKSGSLRPSGHNISRAQGGKHTEQDAAERSNKGKMSNWGKKVSRGQRQRVKGQAGVYQQHEPTHDSQSKTYGNPSLPRGYREPQAQRK